MTLTKVMIICVVAGLILTFIIDKVFKKRKSWLLSFIQNFTGFFFLFSGIVKAVDPLGTAYKMDQYFSEFQDQFARMGMDTFSQLFPWLASFSTGFSVGMIVLELVLGVALIIGFSRFWTSVVFFLTVVMFTVLTGFTYLTGYVPGQDYVQMEKQGITKEVLEDEGRKLINDGWTKTADIPMHFFKFSKWVPFDSNNQKVTDCGCFGDFLVLKPRTSFYKDIFLMIPAFLMLFGFRSMHQIFKPGVRTGLIALSTAGFLVYCISNYVWDIPKVDFRPFANGVDINARKALEEKAAEEAPVNYVLTNKANGQVERMPMDTYLTRYKDFPKSEWDILQQRGEPTVKSTKISEFEVSDVDGNNVTEDILSHEGVSLMVVSYKLYHDTKKETYMRNDTLMAYDTVDAEVIPRVVSVTPVQESREKYIWNTKQVDSYKDKILPMAKAGATDGVRTFAITAYASKEKVNSFLAEIGADFPMYTADDILLKTIVRSNPGVLLIKDGKILHKWHYKKLPSYEEMKAEYLN